MSSVQGPPGKPQEPLLPPEPMDDARSVCPECQQRFARTHPLQIFCTPRHRDRWNNRAAVRGRVLTPLQMVARITRNGTRGSAADREAGKRASSQLNYLINRYRDEDAQAQRMAWPAYMALRYATGFDPL
jgi:hypothetical protein